MKYLKDFSIVFDGDVDTFYPGEHVKGSVLLNVQHNLQIKDIRVLFKGKSVATVFVGTYDSQTEIYFVREKHLKSKRASSDTHFDLSPGQYELPFKFTLPESVPYSFRCEGDEYCAVSYKIKAIINMKKYNDIVHERPFTVNGVLDLSTITDSQKAIGCYKEKLMKCLVFKTGTISATFSLNKKGYVRGETIYIYAKIVNSSWHRIKTSYVSLVQRITLKVYGHNTFRSHRICRRQRGSIQPGDSDTWDGEPLQVPHDLQPSFLLGCQLVDVQYYVKLVVVPTGLSRNLRVPLDIIIGTFETDMSKAVKTVHESTISLYDHGTPVDV